MRIAILRWNSLTFDLERELERRGHKVFTSKNISEDDLGKFDVVVNWNESEATGQTKWTGRKYVEFCKKLGIKTVLLQVGRRGSARIYPPFNEKILSDKVCLWGEGDKRRLLEVGTPEDKLVVTGTPIFKYLKPREKHEGINIVFNPEHWDNDVVENQIVAGSLRKLKGVKITTKLLEEEHFTNIYDNPVLSNRHSEEHLEICANVLKTADLVVGISESTFELMAEILDIPVIIADIWMPKSCKGDKMYMDYKREYSNACELVKFDKLNEIIYKRLKHPEYLKEERRQISIEDGGINLKDPVSEIIKVIL